jgi:hypothetical protein
MTNPLQKRTSVNRSLLDGVQFNVPLIALTRDDPDHGRRERMTGPDHYREAERLLDEATTRGDFNPRSSVVPGTGQAAHGSGPRRGNRPDR